MVVSLQEYETKRILMEVEKAGFYNKKLPDWFKKASKVYKKELENDSKNQS